MLALYMAEQMALNRRRQRRTSVEDDNYIGDLADDTFQIEASGNTGAPGISAHLVSDGML